MDALHSIVLELPALGLTASYNLGCLDIYPSTSGKEAAAGYLMKRWTAAPQHCAFMCDDDNDLKLASLVGRALVVSIGSVSGCRAAEPAWASLVRCPAWVAGVAWACLGRWVSQLKRACPLQRQQQVHHSMAHVDMQCLHCCITVVEAEVVWCCAAGIHGSHGVAAAGALRCGTEAWRAGNRREPRRSSSLLHIPAKEIAVTRTARCIGRFAASAAAAAAHGM
jgi:hypothetical protein